MASYQHILVAVDLQTAHDTTVVSQALALAKSTQTEISIIHVIEQMHTYGTVEAYSSVFRVVEDLRLLAREQLTKLSETYDIEAEHIYLEEGDPAVVIVDKASNIGADLIVVGSHSKQGLNLLLGSTADSILHRATVDVLAVRVK